ncbi:TetR/AcrR family transcriptional regulator [Lactiplantibacillus daowaiensis]|uniref:TetR/AcrR family transcriptional regulator n=1 Tax=Lactiplantibacillus daowaiensis TaxID=2559918 RepID=A0ABW1S074_9LACO|nr:helix-turn-helix domain-containing protein [Lactiplantibacillus daowaiensis]
MQLQTKLSRILTSAQAQFIVPGFADTKMHDIAQAADLAVGTLYNLFKSKDDLLAFIFAATLNPTIIDEPHTLPLQPIATSALVEQTQAVYQHETQRLVTRIQAAPADDQFTTLVTELFATFEQFGAYFLILERNPQMNPTLMTLYRHYRQNMYHTIAQIISHLSATQQLRPLAEPQNDALIIIDEIFWWSAHKKYDSFERQATTFDFQQVKAAVIQQLVTSYQQH